MDYITTFRDYQDLPFLPNILNELHTRSQHGTLESDSTSEVQILYTEEDVLILLQIALKETTK